MAILVFMIIIIIVIIIMIIMIITIIIIDLICRYYLHLLSCKIWGSSVKIG